MLLLQSRAAVDTSLSGATGIERPNVASLSTQSATRLDAIPANTMDYIFTDPPYADNVQYGELNFVWEAWLDVDTHWHEEEIIVNDIRAKARLIGLR